MHAHRSYTRPARCTYPAAAMAIAAALILYLVQLGASFLPVYAAKG
jgi:hypothetical protein